MFLQLDWTYIIQYVLVYKNWGLQPSYPYHPRGEDWQQRWAPAGSDHHQGLCEEQGPVATGGAAGFLEKVPLNCEDLCHADFSFLFPHEKFTMIGESREDIFKWSFSCQFWECEISLRFLARIYEYMCERPGRTRSWYHQAPWLVFGSQFREESSYVFLSPVFSI